MAIQVSRLNEAMLIAFSAMSPSNLKAIDQVVKIVRELDRYGGAFAAEWARPEAPRLDAPAVDDAAFASAWLYGVEPAPPSPVAALHSPSRDGRPHGRPTERGDAVDDRVYNAPSGGRPENPPQSPEKVESAPGIPVAALAERGDAVNDRVDKAAGSDDGPENSAQSPEKVESGARDWDELSDRRGLSSRPGLHSRSHPEPVEERCGSPGPPLRLERAASRHVWRRGLSVCRPGGRRPPEKSGATS